MATRSLVARYRHVKRTSSYPRTYALGSRSSNKELVSNAALTPNPLSRRRQERGLSPLTQACSLLPAPRGEGLGTRGLRRARDRFLIASAPPKGEVALRPVSGDL